MVEKAVPTPWHSPKVTIAPRNFAISITVFDILGFTVAPAEAVRPAGGTRPAVTEPVEEVVPA